MSRNLCHVLVASLLGCSTALFLLVTPASALSCGEQKNQNFGWWKDNHANMNCIYWVKGAIHEAIKSGACAPSPNGDTTDSNWNAIFSEPYLNMANATCACVETITANRNVNLSKNMLGCKAQQQAILDAMGDGLCVKLSLDKEPYLTYLKNSCGAPLVTYEDIKYNEAVGQQQAQQSKPVAIPLYNCQSTAQTVSSNTKTWTTTTQTTFKSSTSTTVSAGATMSAGVPEVAGGEFTVSASSSFGVEWGKTDTKTVEDTVSCSREVPPQTKTTCYQGFSTYTLNVPFTGTRVTSFKGSGGIPAIRAPISGSYEKVDGVDNQGVGGGLGVLVPMTQDELDGPKCQPSAE